MKITVTGTRGIPGIQGGVETHCEELYPRLASLNYEVFLIRRSCYVSSDNKIRSYKGVELVDIFTLRKPSIEALLHTFLSVLKARTMGTDILHIHAIGPALLVPMARALGLKVVFTHHGPDYDRAKWGTVAKFMLRLGEKWGTKYANEVIVISNVIKDILKNKYRRSNTILIYNGFTPPVFNYGTDYIKTLGLEPQKYIFCLGRFVEEKGFDMLIRAFSDLNQNDCRLVIAGDADHETNYSKNLKKTAVQNKVILTGFIKGERLQQLFTNARLFILPSFHEGLPISLLEAMSYRLPVLVSDIPANKQVNLSDKNYFVTGDENSLKKGLYEWLKKDFQKADYDMSAYNWDLIAGKTASVYEKLAGNCKSSDQSILKETE